MKNDMQENIFVKKFTIFFTFFLVIFSIFYLYKLALPGFWLFDDQPNLNGLETVNDIQSGIAFSFSGIAGPLGRPIALSTFAIQSAAWPDKPALMLQANIAIHLMAVVACFALATGLMQLRWLNAQASLWVGLATAALWGLSPFLATTHLMIIQRMSSLSGFFVFSGLAVFVWAHLLAPSRLVAQRLLLLGGLGLATAFAAWSKETGALLPLFALLILWLWIPPERRLHDRGARWLIALLVIVPCLALLTYIAQQLPGTLEHGYGAHREFTPIERLMSQPGIMLDYLRNLLLPRVTAVSPFMDQLPTPNGWLQPPMTLIAALFWPALLLIAVYLRRRTPHFLFGLAFFLAGHVLESTFFGLELYFAHRNYMPSFGLYFALVCAIASAPASYRSYALTGMVFYVFLFAFVLFSVTSSWNYKLTNAEAWVRHNPYSLRGAQFLSTQYIRNNDFVAARKVLDQAAFYHPAHPLLHIQRTSNCIGREAEFSQLMDEVTEILRTTSLYQPQAAQELAKFAQSEPENLCTLRDYSALATMADALLENPLYKTKAAPKSLLYVTKAFASAQADSVVQALDEFEHAFRAQPNLDMAFYGVSLMANAGEYERAYAFLQEARDSAPTHPLKHTNWLQRLNGFIAIIEQSERIDRGLELPSSAPATAP